MHACLTAGVPTNPAIHEVGGDEFAVVGNIDGTHDDGAHESWHCRCGYRVASRFPLWLGGVGVGWGKIVCGVECARFGVIRCMDRRKLVAYTHEFGTKGSMTTSHPLPQYPRHSLILFVHLLSPPLATLLC